MTRNFLHHLHPQRVSRFALKPTTTWGLGIACLGCLLVLFVTGVTLFLYYLPEQDKAYERILHITTTLHYGSLVRSLHYLAANTLIIFAALHLTRVVLTGSYAGRWLNWIYGLILLGLVLFASFTGYLLPWDQISYWAVKVGASLADYIPLLGDALKTFLLGGDAIGHETLLRSFALHAGIIPPLLLIMTGLHLWRIRKDGGLAAPEESKAEQLKASPWLYRAEGTVLLGTWTLLVLLSFWIEAPIFERADPAHPPNPAKAPWFFVGLQEMVSYSAFWGGVVAPTLLALFLLLLPKLDRSPGSGGRWLSRDRRRWVLLYLALFTSQVLFILLGQFCRGRNWQLIWPF